jgi:hypothetical protein
MLKELILFLMFFWALNFYFHLVLMFWENTIIISLNSSNPTCFLTIMNFFAFCHVEPLICYYRYSNAYDYQLHFNCLLFPRLLAHNYPRNFVNLHNSNNFCHISFWKLNFCLVYHKGLS